MNGRRRELRGAVVVITGASSGIGRLAARTLAGRGAKVVLAARGERALAEAARECEAAGGEALAVRTDVGEWRQVEELARRAAERFDRIDVWINNAAVMSFGRFEDTPPEVYDRVIRTNLLGEVNGARAALPYFRRQGVGALINLSSMWARVTSPYVSAYTVSHFGASAFSASLRQELRHEPGISVTVIDPPSVDTPIFAQAANYVGREFRPVPPILPPERVVEAIVDCIERPRAEVIVGKAGRVLAVGSKLFPRLMERLAAPAMDAVALGGREVERGPGNVFEPQEDLDDPRGGWRSRRRHRFAGPLAAAGAVARELVSR